VPPPSPDFTTYLEGELVQVSVPSNWRQLPGFNAVTFAPDGAYGNAGIKSVFTHGVAMGVARNDPGDLRVYHGPFHRRSRARQSNPRQTFSYRPDHAQRSAGLETTVSSVSEATGRSSDRRSSRRCYTTARSSTAAVTPRACALEYTAAFRRIVASIDIRDRQLSSDEREARAAFC
jgi:hypothetical protein